MGAIEILTILVTGSIYVFGQLLILDFFLYMTSNGKKGVAQLVEQVVRAIRQSPDKDETKEA